MILETERLQIRKLIKEDASFFYELVNDADWKRFIGDRNIHTVLDAKSYLTNKIIPSYTYSGFGFYAVIEKKTGRPIGISGFVDRDGLDFIDVGFAFLPMGRNKGYAYESTKALIEFGKEYLGFDTILAIANNENKRSHQLLTRLGFSFKKFIKLNNETQEISLFSNQ